MDIKYEGILKFYLFGLCLMVFAICGIAFIIWWYSEPSLGILATLVTPIYMILVIAAEIKIFILKRSLKRANQ